jgi:hypothetical protein
MPQRGQSHRLSVDWLGLAGCWLPRRQRSRARIRGTFRQILLQPAGQVPAVSKRSCRLRPLSCQRDQAQIVGLADERSRRTTWLPMGRTLTQLRRSYSTDAQRLHHLVKGWSFRNRGSNRHPSRRSCQTCMQVPYSIRTYAQVLSECSRPVGSSVACIVRRPARAPTGAVKGTEKMAHSCEQADKKATRVRRRTGRPVRVSPATGSRQASWVAHRRIAHIGASCTCRINVYLYWLGEDS